MKVNFINEKTQNRKKLSELKLGEFFVQVSDKNKVDLFLLMERHDASGCTACFSFTSEVILEVFNDITVIPVDVEINIKGMK